MHNWFHKVGLVSIFGVLMICLFVCFAFGFQLHAAQLAMASPLWCMAFVFGCSGCRLSAGHRLSAALCALAFGFQLASSFQLSCLSNEVPPS